ncbi:T9SS type A sorting domain-containing protein [Aequorivita sp. H23M31]|uniref:T9SS type A sorting domain-containing protein n=1 Tax=Aequorivita ciconiae TaxID=2494375 RepID=A0A410G6P9_9FLAO|nr:leucine-rich repeat domain-containing protein [Aequorivita sp. H23M31]QAA82943.1 T9SS type A sorting domain-containing protein [Aequorivita sp. H23M31]
MRTKFLFIFLYIFFGTLFSQTISIPDPNFKLKIIADGVDTNGDGEIQVSEALATTQLDVRSLNNDPNKITNLQGIEYFGNLIELNCSGNLLSTLDVTALTSLQILKAYFNELTSINVTGLVNLENLWVSGNQLPSLDLSTLQNLKWIFCSDNQLTALDLSALQSLETIWADNNQIETLDLLPQTNLGYIIVANNLLDHLDVNHLSDLEILYASNNNIDAIDVSNMPNLQILDVGGNQLEEIDCSSTGVDHLHCDNNPDLISINVQNGVISYSDPDGLDFGFLFYNLPSLESICMDPGEEQALADSGYDPENVVIYTGPNCTLSNTSFNVANTYVYPNPVDSDFNLSAFENITNYFLYDSLGRSITASTDYQFVKAKINSLQSGLYFLKIETLDISSETLRFVKK